MLLFIIFFFAMVIVVGSAAVFAFSIILKRRQKKFGANFNQRQFDAPPYRSLFEPTDEELREAETQNRLAAQQRKIADEQTAHTERIGNLREFEQVWKAQTNRQNTVELLRMAAQTDSADVFSQTAENVIEICLRERILTANELADLLDSHLKILPQQERTAGAAFWLKEKIKTLRDGSE